MSKLKEAFQGICQRHLCNDETIDALNSFIRVPDLCKIVETYLVDEFSFETELMILAFCSTKRYRLARLTINCRNTHVHNWLYFLRKRLDITTHDDLHYRLTYAFLWGTHCNRPCCWYQYNSDARPVFTHLISHCGCEQQLNFTNVNAPGIIEIFKLFSHLEPRN